MTPAPHPARPADDPYRRTVDQQQREIDRLTLRVAVLEGDNFRLARENARLASPHAPSRPRWWETVAACLVAWTEDVYNPERV